MEALVKAAPEGVRFPEDKRSAAVKYPEFVAWHNLLPALFDIEVSKWERVQVQPKLTGMEPADAGESADEEDEGEGAE